MSVAPQGLGQELGAVDQGCARSAGDDHVGLTEEFGEAEAGGDGEGGGVVMASAPDGVRPRCWTRAATTGLSQRGGVRRGPQGRGWV